MSTKISIVIPARNEQEYLPRLLDSIVAQRSAPDEVVVVDSLSTDDTVNVAESYKDRLNLRVVTPKEKGLAQARNAGAATIKNDYLVFIDSDIRVADNFIQELRSAIATRHLDIGGFPQRTDGGTLALRIGGRVMNGYVRLMSYTPWPIFFSCFFASREVHERLNGFDTDIFIMEDYDYALRARRLGYTFGLVRRTRFYASARRFEEAGSKSTIWRGIYAELYRYTHGMRITKEIFHYEMGGDSGAGGKKPKKD